MVLNIWESGNLEIVKKVDGNESHLDLGSCLSHCLCLFICHCLLVGQFMSQMVEFGNSKES